MPGTLAHPAAAARDGRPARPANKDAGHIIANNIITDFGYGDSHWIWHVPQDNCTPLRFGSGHELDDPPLRDVGVTGNLVYDTGADGVLTNWGAAAVSNALPLDDVREPGDQRPGRTQVQQ